MVRVPCKKLGNIKLPAGARNQLCQHVPPRRCLEELRICTTERREAVLPVFYDVHPGNYDAALLTRSYYELRADLPKTPRDTKQRWVDALTWVQGISGITGWVHSSAKECAAAVVCGQVPQIVFCQDQSSHSLTDRAACLCQTHIPA